MKLYFHFLRWLLISIYCGSLMAFHTGCLHRDKNWASKIVMLNSMLNDKPLYFLVDGREFFINPSRPKIFWQGTSIDDLVRVLLASRNNSLTWAEFPPLGFCLPNDNDRQMIVGLIKNSHVKVKILFYGYVHDYLKKNAKKLK